MKLKWQIAAIGVEKSPIVSASISGEIRWRSNSLRSAYKIARCVAGFRSPTYKSFHVSSYTNVRASQILMHNQVWGDTHFFLFFVCLFFCFQCCTCRFILSEKTNTSIIVIQLNGNLFNYFIMLQKFAFANIFSIVEQ